VPYILITVIAVAYFAGWLPASWSVALLLTLVVLTLTRRSPRGPTRRRGGYIHPRPNASGSASPGTVERVATYTASSRSSGDRSEARTAFTPPPGPSRTTAPGSSTSGTGGSPGAGTTDVDRSARAWLREQSQEHGAYVDALEAYERGERRWPGTFDVFVVAELTSVGAPLPRAEP
jgi:hypothetical protein